MNVLITVIKNIILELITYIFKMVKLTNFNVLLTVPNNINNLLEIRIF